MDKYATRIGICDRGLNLTQFDRSVPISSESGKIRAITNWIVARACAGLRKGSGAFPLYCGNVSHFRFGVHRIDLRGRCAGTAARFTAHTRKSGRWDGNPWYRADVGIRSGRIAAIGALKGRWVARTVDVQGQVIAPDSST